MRYAVIDLETTGFSAAADRVVEMACVIIQDGRIGESWSTLVDPQRPIPPHATRVHGITDADVASAPSFAIAQRALRRMCRGATVVAHNARFDLSFLPALHTWPSLCTVALARRCFPGAPNYRNQTLREYLEIQIEDAVAHRALGDAMVTAHILLRCLSRYGTAMSA